MTRQLPTTIITTSYAYTARLHRSVTVGALAQYVSQLEANVNAGTLEIARALPLDMRVQAINMQAGDRLLIANDPIKTSNLALPPRAGEQFVRIEAGAMDVRLRGKRNITVGWSDKNHLAVPDVDLRGLVTPETLPYLAQDCLRIKLEKDTWYAQRMGDTRIMIDELDLMTLPVPLNPNQRVRLYSSEHSRGRAYPLVEFNLSLETIDAQEAVAPLPSGDMLVSVQPGIEGQTRFLNASERLTLRQIIAALAQYDSLALSNASVYIAHVLPLDTALHQIVNEDAFLHVPLETRYARRVLQLQDIYHSGQVYNIRSGRSDTRMNLGWRTVAEANTSQLDLDLYPSLNMPPSYYPNASEVKAYLNYSAFAETWSINAEDTGQVGVFINNMQVGHLPIRVATGDVISFGSNVANPFVRLKADINVE